jgi:hypothetical protein
VDGGAGCLKRSRIDIKIILADRVGLVGEVVEEAGDVPPLPTVCQVHGNVRVGMEIEVPGALGDLALLVVVGAGQRRFHSGEADHVVAVPQRVREPNHGAKIMPNYGDRSVHAELVVDELVKVASDGPFVVAITGLGGSTGAAVVGYDDLVAGRYEGGDDPAPRVAGLWRTVDQQHCLGPGWRDTGEGVADANASGPVDRGPTASRLCHQDHADTWSRQEC